MEFFHSLIFQNCHYQINILLAQVHKATVKRILLSIDKDFYQTLINNLLISHVVYGYRHVSGLRWTGIHVSIVFWDQVHVMENKALISIQLESLHKGNVHDPCFVEGI